MAAYTQDELTTLFQRNLSLQQPAPAPTPALHTEIKYSISQHYHHSSHVVPTPPAPAQTLTDDHTIAIILSRHGVDPSTLFPSQIELFRSADSSQQMRLVELWRISPPNYGGHALTQSMDGTYPDTNFEMEEHMARARYARTQQEEEQQRMERAQMEQQLQESAMQDDMMSEEEQSNAPLTPIQGGDGRWLFSPPEPYMESGYEQLAQREYEASKLQQPVQGPEQSRDAYSLFGTDVGGPSYSKATDPVYASMGAVGSAWADRLREEQEMKMAQQYGQCMQQMHGQEDEEML